MITTIIIVLIIGYLLKDLVIDLILPSQVDPLNNDNGQLNDPAVIEGNFTPTTLMKYNGSDHAKIFMAVKGKVYDVSQGASFYGPGGPYENFAGRDASRGLAKNSFDLDMLTAVDKPIDDLKDLTEDEIDSLNSWQEHFEMKYKVVGTLNEPETN